MNRIEILATGSEFIKKGTRAVEPVMEEIIRDSKSEIHIMAYIFTPKAIHLLDLLKNVAERGVRIVIIINNLYSLKKSIVQKLINLTKELPNIKIFDFKDSKGSQLHAKIVISDRRKAVVGSANFSWGGLYTNYEIGLLIEGDQAWKLAEMSDMLASKSDQLRVV